MYLFSENLSPLLGFLATELFLHMENVRGTEEHLIQRLPTVSNYVLVCLFNIFLDSCLLLQHLGSLALHGPDSGHLLYKARETQASLSTRHTINVVLGMLQKEGKFLSLKINKIQFGFNILHKLRLNSGSLFL